MLIVGVRGIIAVDVLAELYKTKQEEVFFSSLFACFAVRWPVA